MIDLETLSRVHPTAARIIEITSVVCPVCRQSLVAHTRCRSCTILVGPGHVETASLRGQCCTCYGRDRQCS